MYAKLLPRRCRQATACLRVAGLRVTEVRRDAAGQQRGRFHHPLRPPKARGLHNLLPTLGRRDAGMGRDDVGQRFVPGVADSREDRFGRAGDRTDNRLVLEGSQVCSRSPTAHHGDDVAVAPAEGGDRPGDGGRRTGALHSDRHMRDTEPEPRTRELPEEVSATLGTRAGDQADVQRNLRQGKSRITPEQAFGLQGGEKLGPLCRQPTEQCRDVDLGQDQAELALGPVEVERPSQDHHHPLRQLNALLGQTVPEGCPRTAPALHIERGHATPRPVPPGTLVLGVDQAQIEVARAMIRHVLDLPPHPEVPISGKGQVERSFDLLVDATDGVDPATVLSLVTAGLGLEIRGGDLGRSLGIEELTWSA
jgi:hypothetical protein